MTGPMDTATAGRPAPISAAGHDGASRVGGERPGAAASGFAAFKAATAAAVMVLAGCVGAPPTRELPPEGAPVLGSAPGPVRGTGAYVWSPQMESTAAELRSSLRGSAVEVARTNDDRIWLVVSGESFETGRGAVKPAVGPALDRIAAAIQSRPRSEVRIVGHTDSRGEALSNDVLSVDRAASVRDWLVMRGVPAFRFSVAGRGAREPIASNDTDAGRASNRRVEILMGEPRQ